MNFDPSRTQEITPEMPINSAHLENNHSVGRLCQYRFSFGLLLLTGSTSLLSRYECSFSQIELLEHRVPPYCRGRRITACKAHTAGLSNVGKCSLTRMQLRRFKTSCQIAYHHSIEGHSEFFATQLMPRTQCKTGLSLHIRTWTSSGAGPRCPLG